jgi:hypothetical protein
MKQKLALKDKRNLGNKNCKINNIGSAQEIKFKK